MATQEPLFTHDVSLTATVSTIFLLFGIKVVVGTSVTCFVVVYIDPSTPLAVLALLLLWLFGHFVLGCGIGENGSENSAIFRMQMTTMKEFIAHLKICISNPVKPNLELVAPYKTHLDIILDISGTKAPRSIIFASLISKIIDPSSDTRKHQKQLGGKRSLRSLDGAVSTVMFSHGLYPTATEGALTRAFEKAEPYTLEYSGMISPEHYKKSFLQLQHSINTVCTADDLVAMMQYMLCEMVEKREREGRLKRTVKSFGEVSLKTIDELLKAVFKIRGGIAAVPEIVSHCVCEVALPYLWGEKNTIKPLKGHTTPDGNSKSLGDVEGYRSDGTPFLVAEVKFGIKIDDKIVDTFRSKVDVGSIPLKLILTTAAATGTSYTDDNIQIGTVNEFVTRTLHACMVSNPDILKSFLPELRKRILAYRSLDEKKKNDIESIFTKYAEPPSPA